MTLDKRVPYVVPASASRMLVNFEATQQALDRRCPKGDVNSGATCDVSKGSSIAEYVLDLMRLSLKLPMASSAPSFLRAYGVTAAAASRAGIDAADAFACSYVCNILSTCASTLGRYDCDDPDRLAFLPPPAFSTILRRRFTAAARGEVSSFTRS